MNERIALIEDLMKKHLGTGIWKYELKEYLGPGVLGRCWFSKRVLAFNRYYIENATEEDVRETVLHEITHALGWLKHDKQFKKIAQQIGCSGVRAYRPKAIQVLDSLPSKYIIRCPKCLRFIRRNIVRCSFSCRMCKTRCEVIKVA